MLATSLSEFFLPNLEFVWCSCGVKRISRYICKCSIIPPSLRASSSAGFVNGDFRKLPLFISIWRLFNEPVFLTRFSTSPADIILKLLYEFYRYTQRKGKKCASDVDSWARPLPTSISTWRRTRCTRSSLAISVPGNGYKELGYRRRF